MSSWEGFDRPPLWTSGFCHDLHCMWNGCVVDGILTLTHSLIWRQILFLLDPFMVQSNQHLPFKDSVQSACWWKPKCPQIRSVMPAKSFYLQSWWERQSMMLFLLVCWYTCQTMSGWVREKWRNYGSGVHATYAGNTGWAVLPKNE